MRLIFILSYPSPNFRLSLNYRAMVFRKLVSYKKMPVPVPVPFRRYKINFKGGPKVLRHVFLFRKIFTFPVFIEEDNRKRNFKS
jgi:hypothetical protein